MASTAKRTRLLVELDPEQKRELTLRAMSGERRLTDEIRLAIRAWLKTPPRDAA